MIKKILLTPLYPFWFFLSETWVGCIMLFCMIPLLPAFSIMLLFPVLQDGDNDTAGGLVIFSLLISPFLYYPIELFGDYLKRHYAKWGYKIEMETKM